MNPLATLVVILGVILLAQFAARLGLAKEAGVRPAMLAFVLLSEEGVRFGATGAAVFFATPYLFGAFQSDVATYLGLAAAVVAAFWAGRLLAAGLARLPMMAPVRAAALRLRDAGFLRLGYVRAPLAALR